MVMLCRKVSPVAIGNSTLAPNHLPFCVPLQDTDTDKNNCGACDSKCPPGFDCIDGECGCPSGTVLCQLTGGLSACVPGSSTDVCPTCEEPSCPVGEIPVSAVNFGRWELDMIPCAFQRTQVVSGCRRHVTLLSLHPATTSPALMKQIYV